MFTEIVMFSIPPGMSREEVVDRFEASAEAWRGYKDLVRKNYLYDPEEGRAGGVYLWKNLEAAKQAHNAEWIARTTRIFSAPSFQYFETPIVVDNTST